MAGDWVLELLVKGKEMFQSADKRYVLLKFPSKTEKWVSGLVLRIKFSRASSLFFCRETNPANYRYTINQYKAKVDQTPFTSLDGLRLQEN